MLLQTKLLQHLTFDRNRVINRKNADEGHTILKAFYPQNYFIPQVIRPLAL